MGLYSDPPPLRPFSEDKPTLLLCWWFTIFCAVIILLRLGGRFVRTETLFAEDKAAAWALIPLFLRMGCVHVILFYGTNNADLYDVRFDEEILRKRSIGSGLVLLSRILYAATLWVLKNTILEFFRRLNITLERRYEISLGLIRYTLALTFVAIIISDLAECRPMSHHWQVWPDPGGQCRQGYPQLLTAASCNVLTDLLLVLFPVPIIVRSQMRMKRKVQLVLLFSFSLVPVAFTLYRVPHIIWDHGSQQSRSLYASVDLFLATAAANCLVLGSFVRDRGIKKNRYKHRSLAAGRLERSLRVPSRQPTISRQWGSDEDLVRDIGFGLISDLRDPSAPPTSTPAPLARKSEQQMHSWPFPSPRQNSLPLSDDKPMTQEDRFIRRSSTMTLRRMPFYHLGYLWDEAGRGRSRPASPSCTDQPTLPLQPSASLPSSTIGVRRGSATLAQDLGAFTDPSAAKLTRSRRPGTELETIPSLPSHPHTHHEPESSYPCTGGKPDSELTDPAGLLTGRSRGPRSYSPYCPHVSP